MIAAAPTEEEIAAIVGALNLSATALSTSDRTPAPTHSKWKRAARSFDVRDADAER